MIFANRLGADDVSIDPRSSFSTQTQAQLAPSVITTKTAPGPEQPIVPLTPDPTSTPPPPVPSAPSPSTPPPTPTQPIIPQPEEASVYIAPPVRRSSCPWWCWALIAVGVGTVGTLGYVALRRKK